MNVHLRKLLPLSIASLALCLSSTASAADQTKPKKTPEAKTASLARLYPHGQRAADIMRMNVRGTTGENLGKVDDLVVDTDSGDVVYAIVSTGGVAGMGDTLRAVPFSALDYTSERRDALTLKGGNLDKWRAAPVYQENQLARLADEAQGRQIYEYYGEAWNAVPARRADQPTSATRNLRSAQALADADVRTGDRKIGHTEDLIVDKKTGKAAVLIDPDDAFVGNTKKYVVPFSKLTARTGDDETLATNLTAQDFSSGKALDDSWTSSSASSAYVWDIDPSAVAE
ncbi:MAG: PRC-barrel domain-containing protein [Opitutus sp.]